MVSNVNNELSHFRGLFDIELKQILSYWIRFAVDIKSKGFYGAVNLDGKPVPEANKSCVLNTRILWTFSAAAKMYGNVEYMKIAERAFSVVTDHFSDKENGGFFMELSPANHIVNDTKHTYVQAFALYSLCKYYEFNSSKAVMDLIQNTFNLLEEKAKDTEDIGYFEAFTRDWQPIEENRMADNNEPKSMNTHLHVLEAYAALYKVWKSEVVKERLTELMHLFLNKIIRKDGHLGIFFDESFNESESSKGICSFGHDIEASWLLLEAAEIHGDLNIIKQMRPRALLMAKAVYKDGVDKNGGLFLESYNFGNNIRTNKHWWLQAENLVGFMNAFQLSSDIKHWDTVKSTWHFIDKYVIDHKRGEWYTKVNQYGEPYLTEPKDDPSPYYRNDWKIDPWKCPYHNGRAMMELINRIDSLTN